MIKAKENIKIYVNETYYCTTSIGKVMGSMFGYFLPTLHLMNINTIKNLINNVCEMIQEIMFEHRTNIHFNRKMDKAKRFALSKKYSKEDLLTFITDTFLTTEGLSTLPGFNMGIMEKTEGGKRRMKVVFDINPEKISVHKPLHKYLNLTEDQ